MKSLERYLESNADIMVKKLVESSSGDVYTELLNMLLILS
jgi:hypothetical protein